MKHDLQADYSMRSGIMNLLSDEEVARVCTAETTERLQEGEEYLDLKRLDQGVRLAMGEVSPMGRVLPKKSIHQDTWNKILIYLTEPRVVGMGLAVSLPTPRNT